MDEDLLLQYVEQVITEMLFTVESADWMNDPDGQATLQKINNILDQFGLGVQQVLPFQMILEYFGGVNQATTALIEAGEDIAPTLAVTPEGLIAAPFQKPIHTKAVEKIVDDSMMDMSAAIATAKASAAATITGTLATVKGDIAKGMIKGDPWKVTQKAVMESFLKDGMTSFQVTDKNGVVRNLPLNFYAMTVVRTKSREATVQGSVNRYVDAGQDLTIVTGNGDQCEICARFNGMVISMTGKTEGYPAIGENGVRLGPYHPNCRCGHRVFMLKFATDEEIKAAKARNKKYKPTGDPRTKEERDAYNDEQKKRRVANAEAKQFARWQDVLGAEAPGNIGAFRAMKRKNSPKYQELKSAYLSATHTKMASPEQIKAADDAAIAQAKKLKEQEAAAAKAKAKAAADKAAAAKAKAAKEAAEKAEAKAKEEAAAAAKAQAEADAAAKEAAEDAKLAKKQAAMKKAIAENKAKKEAEEKAAAAAAVAEAEAKKAKEAVDAADANVNTKQTEKEKLLAQYKQAIAKGTESERAKAEEEVKLQKQADALIAIQDKANKLRRSDALPKFVGEKKVATDVRELRDLFKQGDEMEEDTWKYVAAQHKGMPDLPDKIAKLKNYRQTWMGTSTRRSSAALNDYYTRRLGLPYKPMSNPEWDVRAGIDEDMIALLDTQRDMWQNKLKAKGYTHIRIYRGMNWDGDDMPPWFPTNYDENGFTKANDNEHGKALASWSFDPSAAKGFASSYSDNRVIQEVDIQVEQIWSAFGLGREREIVPLGVLEDVRNTALSPGIIERLGEPAWADELYDPNDIKFPEIYYD